MKNNRHCLDCDKELPAEYRYRRCERCRNERFRKPLGKRNLLSGVDGVKTASKVVVSSSVKAAKFIGKKIRDSRDNRVSKETNK